MSLRIRVREIPSSHDLEYSGSLHAEETSRLREEDRKPETDFSFSSTLRRDRETVFFRGQISGSVQLSCALCLEPVSWTVQESFALILLPEHLQQRLAPEVTLRAEEMDTDYYTDDELDLSVLLEEQVLLNLPIKPLCQENCQGLCSGCGINLNRDACACPSPDYSESPFAVLLNKTPS
jgi:uncharacterized protein